MEQETTSSNSVRASVCREVSIERVKTGSEALQSIYYIFEGFCIIVIGYYSSFSIVMIRYACGAVGFGITDVAGEVARITYFGKTTPAAAGSYFLLAKLTEIIWRSIWFGSVSLDNFCFG